MSNKIISDELIFVLVYSIYTVLYFFNPFLMQHDWPLAINNCLPDLDEWVAWKTFTSVTATIG